MEVGLRAQDVHGWIEKRRWTKQRSKKILDTDSLIGTDLTEGNLRAELFRRSLPCTGGAPKCMTKQCGFSSRLSGSGSESVSVSAF